ncbi:MAG: enoyl-CoA hydratase/isomerase family protein [Clostridioides sp.]|jgi:enoyl-CoA hydratase|nr:enoyl-CoA hydratase/isomerase family protein [Clostridioides sp.]
MDTSNNFLLAVEDGIATLTINRPEVRNAMNTECYAELHKLIDWAEAEESVKVIIITGSGEKAFVSGADIVAVKALTGVKNIDSTSKKTMKAIEDCTKPVIAALNGVAFGGGCELALACDIRIVAEKAKLGLPETSLGIIPGAGGTQRLARIAGIGIAKEMILGGRVLNAQEIVNFGMAMKVVPLESLIDECKTVANTMISKGPLALSVAKKLITASMNTDIETGLLLENFAFGVLLDSEDKLEGANSFLEKRKAIFQGK